MTSCRLRGSGGLGEMLQCSVLTKSVTQKVISQVPLAIVSSNKKLTGTSSDWAWRRRNKIVQRAQPGSADPALTESPQVDPFENKEVYKDDDLLSKFMIRYFSKVMSDQLGGIPYDGTYESFVELSRQIMKGRSTKEQQEAVAGVLGSLLPPQSPERFKKWFPLNRRNAEFNAWITTLGFTWLVGPSELMEAEVEFEGRKEVWKSGVHIKKCRYLENSGCVGMCTNMCKIPTQNFFTDMFGLPLTMNPNFETLECEMIFGQPPPPIKEDPVYNQPCFSVCNIGSGSSKVCPKIDTERSG